jgi:hypothetical protein
LDQLLLRFPREIGRNKLTTMRQIAQVTDIHLMEEWAAKNGAGFDVMD